MNMNQLDTLISDISNKTAKDFFFKKISSFQRDNDIFYDIVKDESRFEDPVKIGEAELKNSDELLVFTCKYRGKLTSRSAKKRQFEIAKKILKEDFKDGAIFIFYDESGNFRFSLIRRYYGKDKKYSNWRRFTYYVRHDKNNKTFKKRISECDFSSLKTIEKAFSVEALSKEFYKKLSHWYFASLNEVTFPNDIDEDQHQINSQAMIRLITRIIFVWFMKQKGLIPEEIFDKEYLDSILNYEDKTGSTYYKAILQNLFFATLNTEMSDKRKWITSTGYGVQHFYRYKRFFNEDEADTFLQLMKTIPFLNGGLFENLDIVQTADKEKGIPKVDKRIDCFSDNKKNEERLIVPDFLFFGTRTADISAYLDDERKKNVEIEGLIDILQRYDFTIDENSIDDQEVALDPELLGTVFENLLASYNPETQTTARKESGSFYTPRTIVDYMVKESLFYHLKGKTEVDDEKLELLIEADQAGDLSAEDKQAIVEALTHIKILDPACGSGAFPMGCLQEMVHLLNLLDPQNAIYKDKLQKKLKADLADTIDESNYEELKSNIEEVFNNRLNDPDYARKLFLIQNCIYGVDIQAIAMQISKLRFFISLLVEQEIDPNEENLGIKPLPNLETKFVAANTLIQLDKPYSTKKEGAGTGFLQDPRLIEKKEDLAQVREKYFNARTYKTKRKYRIRDKELREEIAELLTKGGWADKSAEKIAEWDPFDQNESSEWFEPEWMFGVKAFDLVIGNPPYIRLQREFPENDRSKYADIFKDQNYQTFDRNGDIYCLFYEKGLSLTEQGGLLCYITSNKWMRAGYGKSLRKFFSQKNPLLLIDLGPDIFDAATVDTNILLIKNNSVSDCKLQALTLESKEQILRLHTEPMTLMDELSQESWIILSPEEMAIKKKIERIGTPLKDWDINIYRGVLTGFNKAFIIDGEKRRELVKKDPKSSEIIKPLLRGRDIKRYKVEFADKWLINTHNGYTKDDGTYVKRININDYPAIKEQLDKYWDRIEARYDQGDTPYNLRNCAYAEEFEKEKILFQEMVQESKFAPDRNENYYCLDTARILTGENLKFLLTILNSKLFFFSIKMFYGGGGLGNKGVRMKHTFFNKFPLKRISEEEMKIFEIKTSDILNKKEKGEDTTFEEREIDVMVYKLYELTYDEVKVVDPDFWMSEEEYEGYEW